VAQPTTKNVPAVVKPTPVSVAKKKQDKFIQILKDDFQYDVVKDIIDTMAMIKRAKRIKPLEKYRLIKDYQLTLLSYCLPKIKIQETVDDGSGKGVVFNIQIGGDEGTTKSGLKRAGSGKVTGVNIQVPTTLNKDGSYSLDE
jgi:hypothetical protein